MELLLAAAAALSTILAGYFKWKSVKNSDEQKRIDKQALDLLNSKIAEVEAKIITATETCITDVPPLRLQLEEYRKQLKEMMIIILLLIPVPFISGCWTNDPIVVGERVMYVKPGEIITIPPLKAPAKQWYVMDDEAMNAVLGVRRPVVPKESTGIVK